MFAHTALPIALGIGALIFISLRQLSWQRTGSNQLKMPLLLGLGGVVVALMTWTSALLGQISLVDVLLIGGELCVAIFGGWLMGRLTEIATVDSATRSRLRPSGLAVWFGFIAIRIGFAVLGGVLGAALASNIAVILFMIAIVKAVQLVVVQQRVSRHEAVAGSYRLNAVVGS